jgi:hypothetical protein
LAPGADIRSVIWPVAALAAVFLGFVVVYGSVLQTRLEAPSRRPDEAPADDGRDA